ncbi:hypothetical protein [Urbifossiella limnaea]|uniref:Uncharacterized protein n=1 Tax=Urbifossiella limnaea TaxID=2528023 RepID=A0A517XSV7_9BACT|nr:hypothetical protein [Urbifossiella limnaea]QDU20577.1 hypothetical protein ETAA1_25320 [Urbifossiella limnaea]
MDAATFRLDLAAFLGADEYRKFVRQARQAGRLRYWHERELNRFFDARPDLRLGGDEIFAALRVCELHGDELMAGTAEVIGGHVAYADEYLRTRRDRFPNAASGPFYTQGGRSPGPFVEVWYCPACREAEAAWQEANGSRSRDPVTASLKRRTTYREYVLKWLGDDWSKLPKPLRERAKEREAEVSAKLRPGDELWEYEFGDRNSFAYVSGLAVVRGGVVVEHWAEWKS